MNELINILLQPASPEQPCGPDLSNDSRHEELETLLKGRPEVEMGSVKRPAEPPDWKELQDKSVEYLRRSKHLRVAVIFCCSLLRTSGVAGFRDGLQYVRGLLEQYWPTMHPRLDPDDQNDPTQRLNLLGALAAPRGSIAVGWLAIMDSLYSAPVCRPKGSPPIPFDQLLPGNVPDPGKLAAAVRESGQEHLAGQQQALREAREAVQGIDQFLTSTLGAAGTISFDTIEKALLELLGLVESCLAGATGGRALAAAGVVVPGAAGVVESGGIAVSGSVRSREDVVRTIELICNYYRQVEPGSPVPYLLKRAQKLAEMNFVEAMLELNLATPDALRPSIGTAIETGAPPVT